MARGLVTFPFAIPLKLYITKAKYAYYRATTFFPLPSTQNILKHSSLKAYVGHGGLVVKTTGERREVLGSIPTFLMLAHMDANHPCPPFSLLFPLSLRRGPYLASVITRRGDSFASSPLFTFDPRGARYPSTSLLLRWYETRVAIPTSPTPHRYANSPRRPR